MTPHPYLNPPEKQSHKWKAQYNTGHWNRKEKVKVCLGNLSWATIRGMSHYPWVIKGSEQTKIQTHTHTHFLSQFEFCFWKEQKEHTIFKS